MRKGKAKSFYVKVIDSNGTALLEKKVVHLPLKEEVIIEQSIYHFDDPEPCMIHRSAVMKKIFAEFIDYFEGLFSQGDHDQIEVELPDSLKQKLDVEGEIKSVIVKVK